MKALISRISTAIQIPIFVTALCLHAADESDTFFDDSYVHEIRLTFDDSNWYSTLYNSHANDSDDPYFPASFSCDGVTIEQIGVRMKGNSSFSVGSIKKSLKIDFDQYDEENPELSFFGLKKLNLHNAYKDPTLMREKLFLDFASNYIPTIRAVFVRVYVNDEYLGLYTAVEQVDKNFIQDRWGGSEDGNLYKGAASDDIADAPFADFGSDLAWEGSTESTYYDHYQLKTNEEANDYSGFVEMVNVLNNQDPDSFSSTLEPLMDVDNVLAGLALNSLFSNFDSYTGSAHNYYLYQSDSSGQFSHILWDTNESFGSFAMFNRRDDMREIHPFWSPTGEDRPLMENLWDNASYAWTYLNYHARMLREGFDSATMTTRINELADLIRTDVYADSNKEYSNSAFEQNLTANYGQVYGLQSFVAGRAEYLEGILESYADVADFRINEVVVANDSDYVDGSGEAEPWIEIHNAGLGEMNLSGLYLSDSSESKKKWALPSVTLDDGEFVALWMDGEASEGSDHASFTLSDAGGSLFLYDGSGNLIDTLSYPALGSNWSYERYPDGEDSWIYSDQSTPGAANTISSSSSIVLYINELMAVNTATLQDPAGIGYPDWFEIYNPNTFSIDLGGMYLSDDFSVPTRWRIPDGVEIAAGGFLLFWADNDEEQGSTHTNFKLSSSGEELALFDIDENGNVPIDWVRFGEQTADVSLGRTYDGSAEFSYFETPTPEASNSGDSIQTWFGYNIEEISGSEWVDTGAWFGWFMVQSRPWVWSDSWSCWMYLNEESQSANGSWIWLMNESTADDGGSTDSTYMGFSARSISGGQWIDTGSWIGWIEITNAPWVYSNSANRWVYLNESLLTDAGIWIWAQNP